jgi:hypothetical protein
MRKAGQVIIVWIIIFLVSTLSTVSSFSLLGTRESPDFVIANEDIVHWNFNMDFNATKQRQWRIEFDHFGPHDSSEYTVYPRFYVHGKHANQNAIGSYELTISYFFNGIRHSGEKIGVDWDQEDSSISWAGWSPGEGDLNSFSNATPNQSGNSFEVRLLAEVVIFKAGGGEIDIQAGPLLLYAKESVDAAVVVEYDPLVVAFFMGIFGIPLAIIIVYLIPKLSERVTRSSKRKKRR